MLIPMPKRLVGVGLACGLLAMQPALAADLLEAWQAAVQHDLDFAAAEAAHQAGVASRDQSSALWRPSVQVTGTAGRMNSETQTQGAQFSAPGFPATNNAAFNTSINNGTLDRWAVTARQPLLSRDRLAQSRQLDMKAEMADLEWLSARQGLMLRTAQKYLDVAMAQEALQVARRQLQSVEKALGEAKERYRLGDSPITDTHEALARREAVRAQVLAAETDLQLKQAALADATGFSGEQLNVLEPTRGDIPAVEGTLDQWETAAGAGNPDLLMQQKRVEVSREESARYSALASPSVDLVGEVAQDHLTGSGDYSTAASNTSRTAMLGVQLTIPLYTGGMRSARQRESERLTDKALSETDRTRQQVALQTRSAWLGLTVGADRVNALAAALKASESRLSSTQLGRQVGDRSTLDLLNAESDAANARLAWLQARTALLLDRLRLVALAGKLDEAELQAVNGSLQPMNTDQKP
jgi:outer membrane protein